MNEMPELPEVESVRQGLEKLIIGQKINSVSVLWNNIIKDPSVEDFKKELVGEEIVSIKRRGKFLLFEMTDYMLISHLRMEGKYRLESTEVPLTKHTHVIFSLSNGKELRYLDVRKFGKMSLVDKDKAYDHPSLNSLGPEPNEQLTAEHLKHFLEKRKRSIKACLLDQKMVAGIGNIYADEILFASGVHPERQAHTLSSKEVNQLKKSIINIMEKAVLAGGTTIRTYANAFGNVGSYQNQLRVYGKEGEPCSHCDTLIMKIKVAQRGTHYCPKCQK